jgi:hypothetical protein
MELLAIVQECTRLFPVRRGPRLRFTIIGVGPSRSTTRPTSSKGGCASWSSGLSALSSAEEAQIEEVSLEAFSYLEKSVAVFACGAAKQVVMDMGCQYTRVATSRTAGIPQIETFEGSNRCESAFIVTDDLTSDNCDETVFTIGTSAKKRLKRFPGNGTRFPARILPTRVLPRVSNSNRGSCGAVYQSLARRNGPGGQSRRWFPTTGR